ncbi:Peroxin-3 [Dipodascopsis uninucleata]
MVSIIPFFQRHRRKFVVLFGTVAASYWTFSYLKSRLIELQAKLAYDTNNRENLRRRFEQNQQDASFTVEALLQTLSDPIMKSFDVEKLTEDLKSKRGAVAVKNGSYSEDSPLDAETMSTTSSFSNFTAELEGTTNKKNRSKRELWNDLKLTSITRIITLIHSLSLLIFFTRLQINLIGRQSYIHSVRLMAESDESSEKSPSDPTGGEVIGVNAEINRRYLTYSWWLLNKGWNAIAETVWTTTESVFSGITPRSELSFEELTKLLYEVSYEVDKKHEHYLNDLLPSETAEDELLVTQNFPEVNPKVADFKYQIDAGLEGLLDETRDLIESPNAKRVLALLRQEALKVLLGNMQMNYYHQMLESTVSTDGQVLVEEIDQTHKKVKLASILAGLAHQSYELSSIDENNQYLLAINNNPELTAFSAVIYSSYGPVLR